MTNEEKAREIQCKFCSNIGYCRTKDKRCDQFDRIMQMAEWKDKIFQGLQDKMVDNLRMLHNVLIK